MKMCLAVMNGSVLFGLMEVLAGEYLAFAKCPIAF